MQEDVFLIMQRRDEAQTNVGPDLVVVPMHQLASIYERFLRLNAMGRATVEEWAAMPKEVASLRHAIFEQSDVGAVFSGQFLPHEIRNEIFARVRASET